MVKLKTLSEGALGVATISSIGLMSNAKIAQASTNSDLATKENIPYNDTKDILTKDDYHTNMVHFVYNGKTLATKKYSGYLDQTFDVKKDVPQGYQVKDSHLPTKFGFADQEYSIDLAKAVVPDKQTQLKFRHYSLASVQKDTPQQRLLNNGFIKTSVGYDKAWKNHKLRAVKSSVVISNDNAPGERSSYRETTVKNSPGGYGIDLSATINKNDIVAGNDILVGTIAISDNDDRFLRLSGDENTKTRDVYYHGQRVGYIWSQNNNIPSDFAGNYGRFSDKIDEVGYFLHITNTYNFAKDFEFTYHIDHSRAIEAWNNHYKYIRGTTPDNPMIENWVTVQNGQDKVYTNKVIRGNDSLYNLSEEDYLHQQNVQNTFTNFNPSMYWHSITTNGMNVRDNQNEHISKVIKVQNTNDNPLAQRNDNRTISVHLDYDRIYDANGNTVDWVWRPYELYFQATNIADNLTAEEVQEEAKNLANKDGYAVVRSYNTTTNSYLIGYEMTPSEYVKNHINKQEAIGKISDAIKHSFAYNFYNHKYLDYTIEHYEKVNFQPVHFWLELEGFYPQNDAKPYSTIVTDVTPNAPHVPSSQGSLNPNGQSSSTAVYRPVELRFVDDDDAQRFISSDSVIGVSGENFYAPYLHCYNNVLKYKHDKNNKHYFM